MNTIPPTVADGPDVDAPTREMGPPADEFKARTGDTVAWLVVSGIAFPAAVAGLVGTFVWVAAHGFDIPRTGAPKNQPDWATVGILTASLLGLLLKSGILFRHCWPELSLRVLAYPGGFVTATARELAVFRWNEIASIRQSSAAAVAAEGQPPLAETTAVTVRRTDGREFRFDRNSLRGHRRFARFLYAAAAARGIAWTWPGQAAPQPVRSE